MGKFVVGNWKMNGRLAANEALLAGLQPVAGVEIALCVPFPYLAQVAALSSGLSLGAQNVSEHDDGAFTGEVSAQMLADLGCQYVIVGHSERRQSHGETDAVIGRKAKAALAAGLVPIVCVGETLAQRQAGEVLETIRRQLDAVADGMVEADLARLVLAYEPVWAIGTGHSASAEQVAEVHDSIRAWLVGRLGQQSAVRILYGGSVKATNAAALFALANVDGGLIGGASLIAEEFMAICRQAGG